MKKGILVIILLTSVATFGQFKNEGNKPIDLRQGMLTSYNSSFFQNFLNLNNLKMHNSFSMSYSTFGGQGLALGVFTNTLTYKFSNNLNFLLQTSIVNSPYSTLGSRFSQDLNGIYIRRAELNYRPSKNTFISIQFSNDPTRYYYPGFGYSNFFFDNLNGDSTLPKK